MSDQAYVFQDVTPLVGAPATLLAVGSTRLLVLYDDNVADFIDIGNTEFFSGGCLTARYVEDAPNTHPENSYNVAYPYCRTTVRYRMDDSRSNPQLAQLVPQAPFLVIRIVLGGCEVSDIVSVVSRLEPQQVIGCGAELYPGYSPTELYMVLTASLLTYPTRLTFTVTNKAKSVKEFWIGLRSARDGVPSGALV
jgi:hypothetical protein